MEVLALHELQQLCRMRALPFVGKNKSELIQLLTNSTKPPPAPTEADVATSDVSATPPPTQAAEVAKAASPPVVARAKAAASPVEAATSKEKMVVSPIATTRDKEKDVTSPEGDDSDDETVAALFPSEYASLDTSMLYYLCRVRRLDDDGSRLELIKRLEASDPRRMPVDELTVQCGKLGLSQVGSTGKMARRLMQKIAGVTPKAKQAQETKTAMPLVLRRQTITAMNLTSEDETLIAALFPEDYEKLTVSQLQQTCVSRGLVGSEASKKDLVRRLKKADPRFMTQSLLRGLCLYRGLSQSGTNQDMIERVMVNLYKTHRQTAVASAPPEAVQAKEAASSSLDSVGSSPGKASSTGACESTDSEGLCQESCVSPPSQELQPARPQLGQFSEDPFLHMSKERLTELCQHRGLSVKGSRYEIVQNLLANESEATSPKASAPASNDKQTASNSAVDRHESESEATKAIEEAKPLTADAVRDNNSEASKAAEEGKLPTTDVTKSATSPSATEVCAPTKATPPSATQDCAQVETLQKPVADPPTPQKNDATEEPPQVLAKDRWAQLISNKVNSAASSPSDDNTHQPDDPAAKATLPAIPDADTIEENVASTELGMTAVVKTVGVKTTAGKAAVGKLRATRLAKMVLANDDDDSDNTVPSEHSDDSDFKVDETVDESEDEFDPDEVLLDELNDTPPRKRKPALSRRPKPRRRLVQYLDEAATQQADPREQRQRDPAVALTFEEVFSDHSIASVHSDDSDFMVDDAVEESDDEFDADEGILDYLDATPPKKKKKRLVKKSKSKLKSKKPAARKPNRTMARWLGPAAAQPVQTPSLPVQAVVEQGQDVVQQPEEADVQAEQAKVAAEKVSEQPPREEVLSVQGEEQPKEVDTLQEQQPAQSRQAEGHIEQVPVQQDKPEASNLATTQHTDQPVAHQLQLIAVQQPELALVHQQEQSEVQPECEAVEPPDQPAIQQEQDEVEQPDHSVEPEPVEGNDAAVDFDEVDDFGDDDLLDPHAVDAADMEFDSDDADEDNDEGLLDPYASPQKAKVAQESKQPVVMLPDQAATQEDDEDELELRVQQPTPPTQKSSQQFVPPPVQAVFPGRSLSVAEPEPSAPKPTECCYVVFTIRTPSANPPAPPEFTLYKVFAAQVPASNEVHKVFYGNHPEGWGETVFKCVEKDECIRADYSSGMLKLSVEPPYMPWKAGAVAVPTVDANITKQNEAFVVCSIHTYNPRKNITPPQVECHEVFATREAANAGMAKVFHDECPWGRETIDANSTTNTGPTNREGLHSMCAFNYDGDAWQVNVCKVAGGDAPPPADWFIVYDKITRRPSEEAVVQFFPPVRTIAEANELVKRVFAESRKQNLAMSEHVTTYYNHHGLITQSSRANGIEHVAEARSVPSDSSIPEEHSDSAVVVMSTTGYCSDKNVAAHELTMTVEALVAPGIASISQIVQTVFYDRNPYGWTRTDFVAYSHGYNGSRAEITSRVENALLEMSIAPVGLPTWSVRSQLITSSAKAKTISQRQHHSPLPAQVQRRPQPAAAFGGYGSPVLKVSYSTPSPADVGSSLVHQKKRLSSGSINGASAKRKRLSETQGDITQGRGPGGTFSPPSMGRSQSDEPLETVWPMRAMEETHWIV